MRKKDKIAIIGNYNVSQLNASGKRVMGIADAIVNEYDVLFIGCHNRDTYEQPKDFGSYSFAFFPYATSIIQRTKITKYYKFTIDILKKESFLKAVIIYGSPVLSLYVRLLMTWCQKNGIAVISDCVDMIFTTGSGGLKDIVKKADMSYLKKKLYPQSDGIISISTYIESFYKKKGYSNIVVVPPITQIKENSNRNRSDCVKMIYAGIPFNLIPNIDVCDMKDRLDLAIELFLALVDGGLKAKLKIFGITKNDYLLCVPRHSELLKNNNCITFLGKTSNDRIENEMCISDFSILIRDKNPVTQSGFPTKFSESLSLGIPVITTDTSDILKYLVDGKNGFIVDSSINNRDVNKLLESLENRAVIEEMHNYCKSHYCFSPPKYSSLLVGFISKTIKGSRQDKNE